MHNIAAIASGIARSGADIIAIDGFRGGTGAAPTRIRDNVGIPIELALAAVDQRLREEGIRDQRLPCRGRQHPLRCRRGEGGRAGSRRLLYRARPPCWPWAAICAAPARAGKCNWGIATQRPELVKRLDPDDGH